MTTEIKFVPKSYHDFAEQLKDARMYLEHGICPHCGHKLDPVEDADGWFTCPNQFCNYSSSNPIGMRITFCGCSSKPDGSPESFVACCRDHAWRKRIGETVVREQNSREAIYDRILGQYRNGGAHVW